jgi:hypothetical protein
MLACASYLKKQTSDWQRHFLENSSKDDVCFCWYEQETKTFWQNENNNNKNNMQICQVCCKVRV